MPAEPYNFRNNIMILRVRRRHCVPVNFNLINYNAFKHTGPVSFSEPNHSPGSLHCHYSQQPLTQLLADDKVLAVIGSGPACHPGDHPRHYPCGLASLSQPELHEVWSTSGPVKTGTDGNKRWSQGDEMLFVAQWVDDVGAPSQEAAVYATYASLLSFISERDYPHIVRMWNYMPHINRGEADQERYRQFCLGRQRAFSDSDYSRDTYPSACALGHNSDQTVVYLLAGRTPLTHIENPRQESAYNYPREYGPASPSFARASLADWRQGSQLFLSGTASIVGHQSRFPGDLPGQLQTTFDNIDILLERTATEAGLLDVPRMSLLKVYVRDPDDYEQVRASVEKHFPGVAAQYLQADICRRELLVEIDGLCELPETRAAAAPVQTRVVASE